MPLSATVGKNARVDSRAIVDYGEREVGGSVPEINMDMTRVSVSKGVANCLASDSEDFMTNSGA